MILKLFAATALPILLLAGCGGPSPKATIEEGCRLFAETDNVDEKVADEVCSCMAEAFARNLDKKDLETFATAFEKAESGADLEESLDEAGITEEQFRDAAGSCLS